jgi:tetratricopeptide (TPR) repeat protein
MNPENEAVLYELAYCYDLAEAHEASVAFFRQFTNEHPYSFVAWYNLGNALAKLGRWRRATTPWTSAWRSRTSSVRPTSARRATCCSRAAYEEAIACYQETLNIDGPQAITFSYIGECFEKMERYEQALIHYDQAWAGPQLGGRLDRSRAW